MYCTIGSEFYLPYMANDAFKTVANGRFCAINWRTLRKRSTALTLFSPSNLLEFVAMDKLGPLPKSKRGFASILVITDRFSKSTRGIPLKSASARVIADAVSENRVYAYGTLLYLLTNNGP